MTEQELAAIKQASAEATPGPWESRVVTCCSLHYSHPGGGQHTNVTQSWAVGPIARSGHKAKADADFITGARKWVPQLLAEVDRLRTAVAAERAACAQVAQQQAALARQKMWEESQSQFAYGQYATANHIAAAICQRGTKPKEQQKTGRSYPMNEHKRAEIEAQAIHLAALVQAYKLRQPGAALELMETALELASQVPGLLEEMERSEQEIAWHQQHYEKLEAERNEINAERLRWRMAIEKHRNAQGHERCWLNDLELYTSLGEPFSPDRLVLPPRKEFLERCQEYYEQQKSCQQGGFDSTGD